METVENAGIRASKLLNTVNIKMWRHPKYYKELRKRNREVLRSGRGLAVNQAPHVSDQAISDSVDPVSGVDSMRPESFLNINKGRTLSSSQLRVLGITKVKLKDVQTP